jgi:hypothetical protein
MGILVNELNAFKAKFQAKNSATTISMLVGADKRTAVSVKFLEIVKDLNQDGQERIRVKVKPLTDAWVGTYGNNSIQGGQAAKADKVFYLPYSLISDIFNDITTVATKDAAGADIPEDKQVADVNPEQEFKVLITSTNAIATKV